MGHVQIVELAKLILRRQNLLPRGKTLSITVLLMKIPDSIDTVSGSYSDLLSSSPSSTPGLHFFQLPPTDPTPEWSSKTRGYFIHSLVLSQKSNISDFLRARRSNIAGVLVDMLCTSMIRVAEDFGIPAYVFFTSPASFLGAMLHCQTLQDEKNEEVPGLKNSKTGIRIPSFEKPVPPEVMSLVLVDKRQWLDRFLHYARDYWRAKGILVNTFTDLEAHAIASFSLGSAYGNRPVPPVYPVGPILNHGPCLNRPDSLGWLDEQPTGSVLFVCFGSQGSLAEDQVRELAVGLERSGTRFLWALRRRSSRSAGFPSEYADYEGVLPEGFLDRTASKGRVVGWVPQLEVLGTRAIGGFVCHCGWNSVLESLWCGVPMATWPLHAEQQMNAFQLARELGLAVEISLSYKEKGGEDGRLVAAEKIESGIRAVMERGSEVRRRVEEMRERARASVAEGGPSWEYLDRFVKECVTGDEFE
ncbi:UDP-glycosyltransferase 71B1 [Striga hermonthica]|uniref:Glycosyltransferase n=1 Tax=Striga hermonthica TaxID=68872 RepID=A0A9N7NSG4_STRHE|nr:UDP-glycosyltransferase 71B1 [Striga hermonthica]